MEGKKVDLYIDGKLVGSTDLDKTIDHPFISYAQIGMTEKEAIEQIISEPKFYIGVMPQSTASNFIASWRKGMSKQKTIDAFLHKFGYSVSTPKQWVKQLDGKPINLKTK